MRKAGVVWIDTPGRAQAELAWTQWIGGAAYVISGPGEQPLTGLADAQTVIVTARSADTGGAIVRWTADVRPIRPDSPQWSEVVPKLAAARLNAADADGLAERWAGENRLYALVPTGELHPLENTGLRQEPQFRR